jgi:hypothetical protein
VTAYKPYAVIKNCSQPLDNLQEYDFPAEAPSVTSQPRKKYCSAIKVRSACVNSECQMTKTFSKIHNHHDIANSSNPDTKENSTIPVRVNGQAPSRKSYTIKRPSSNSSPSKDHKVLIIGDSHIRHCASNVKSEIKDTYHVQGLVKPGAGSGTLANSATSDITNLTKNDVIIFCGGANDVAKNNSKTTLRNIRNFINTKIILISVPHRYDLMQFSCVNNEIR